MINKKSLLVFITALMLGFLADSRLYAQSTGATVYNFLELTSSARAAALGGNHVALTDADASMFLINPAYINEDVHRNFSLTYANLVGDVNMGFLGGAWHLDGIGTLGAGLRFINYGEMVRADETGTENGTFGANDLALTVGFAREVLPNLQTGVGVSFIYSSYDVFTSTAAALNAGLYYYLEDADLHIGASVNNFGFQISTYDKRQEPLPLDLRIGFSRRLEYIPIRLSLTAHTLDQWDMPTYNDDEDPGFVSNLFRHLTFGGEILFSDNVQARIGYDHFLHEELKMDNRIDTAGFSFGFGIRYKGIVFDFSRNSFSDIGGITRIGIQTHL